MAKHLGIDFSWILIEFGGQVGAKLGSKIYQTSINKLSVFQPRFCLVFEGFGWQQRLGGDGGAEFLGPPD